MQAQQTLSSGTKLFTVLLAFSVVVTQGSSETSEHAVNTINTGAEINSADYPLSLHLAVLDVTDSLNRETSQASWQAMLRALGGHREILKRFSQIRQEFSTLERRIGFGKGYGIEEKLDSLARMNVSTSWSVVWPTMQLAIKRVADLYSWFDRYQRNAAVVNDRTLRDYAEIVHGQEGLTAQKAMDSLHFFMCVDNDDVNSTECEDQSCGCRGNALDALNEAMAKVPIACLIFPQQQKTRTTHLGRRQVFLLEPSVAASNALRVPPTSRAVGRQSVRYDAIFLDTASSLRQG